MTDEETLRDLYTEELFEEWSKQRDMFDKQDMYKSFAHWLTDRLYDVTQEKQFQEVVR